MKEVQVFAGNWREVHYQNGPYLAYISMGAAPCESEEGFKWLYFLLVTDLEHQEVSSREFETLEAALNALNKQYGNWGLTSRSEQKNGDGCSTCQAH